MVCWCASVLCVYLCLRMCACVCVCVRERERERERESVSEYVCCESESVYQWMGGGGQEGVSVCVREWVTAQITNWTVYSQIVK